MNERFGRGKRTDKLDLRIEPEIKELLGDLAFDEGITISDRLHILQTFICVYKQALCEERMGRHFRQDG